MIDPDRDNQNAVNLLIADVFRVLGALDAVDPRDDREQLEPIMSACDEPITSPLGWNAPVR